MANGDPILETITLDDLRRLPAIDIESGAWQSPVPEALIELLERARGLSSEPAAAILAAEIEAGPDDPEPWWGMAAVQVRLGDFANAATCYENFRDRVEHQLLIALTEAPTDLAAADARLARLAPSLRRCLDYRLAARVDIAHAGLLLALGEASAAEMRLRSAMERLRSLRPRPWPLFAEWLASVAIANADLNAARAVRTLTLALRLSRHDRNKADRSAMIARDLGSLLDRLDRLAEAEEMLGTAAQLALASEDPALVAGVAAARAKNLAAQRDYVGAHAALDMALERPLAPRDRAAVLLTTADLLVSLGLALQDRGRIEQARSCAAEAAALLEGSGSPPRAASRMMAISAAALGDPDEARMWLSRLLCGDLSVSERLAAGYVPYLLRVAQGAHRKALLWAEWRLATAERSGGSPRDLMALREHCVVASQRIGAVDRVRLHARAMLGDEAAMLRRALGRQRGPAHWARLRQAREAMSILAWTELQGGSESAPWRVADALLSGRGLARGARRRARLESGEPEGLPSLRSLVERQSTGHALLALVALHPPAPVDPSRPLWSGFLPPRLIGIVHRFGDPKPVVADLGDFTEVAGKVEQWRTALACGRAWPPPSELMPMVEALGMAGRILFIGEGSFEALPLRLLLPNAEIVHSTGLPLEPPPPSTAAGPAGVHALVAQDMLEDPDWREATRRELAGIGAAAPVTLLCPGASPSDEILIALFSARKVHVIAHGEALRDPAAVELDVYRGAAVELADGWLLTASDVAELPLEKTETVVLSSCDTGLGVRQHAEGQASLAAAFLDAGARWAIAALWPVPHEESARFMALYYAQRRGDPASALLAAQKLAQAEGLSESCWAAWALYG